MHIGTTPTFVVYENEPEPNSSIARIQNALDTETIDFDSSADGPNHQVWNCVNRSPWNPIKQLLNCAESSQVNTAESQTCQ